MKLAPFPRLPQRASNVEPPTNFYSEARVLMTLTILYTERWKEGWGRKRWLIFKRDREILLEERFFTAAPEVIK